MPIDLEMESEGLASSQAFFRFTTSKRQVLDQFGAMHVRYSPEPPNARHKGGAVFTVTLGISRELVPEPIPATALH